MKVAVIGAGGAAGSRIVSELAGRGHAVLALARTPSKVPPGPGVIVRALDASDPSAVTAAVRGQDAVVSAVKFLQVAPERLINGVRDAGVTRYVAVGGAGSLRGPGGEREMDDPRFPPSVKPEAEAGGRFLAALAVSDLDWTFLSPSRFFEPGERTGQFRLGQDDLLFDANGRSAISMEDYAVALVDELERPQHRRARFTVGY